MFVLGNKKRHGRRAKQGGGFCVKVFVHPQSRGFGRTARVCVDGWVCVCVHVWERDEIHNWADLPLTEIIFPGE